MVKLNEALLVGISLLAALVLSKGRGSIPSVSNIPFINPYSDLLNKAQNEIIKKDKTNIETLQNIQNEILEYEKNISNVKINQLQTELDKTQSFISQQQKIQNPLSFLDQFVGSAYWRERKKIGNDAQISNMIKSGILPPNQQATENIAKANELVFRQQNEIDRLQEEYQTRFGSLSRYG